MLPRKKTKIEYTELSKAKVTPSRNIVISSCSKGGYTIAQQMEVSEGNKTTSVFLQGAFQVSDEHGLYNLRDAINVALNEPIYDGPIDEDESGWDE